MQGAVRASYLYLYFVVFLDPTVTGVASGVPGVGGSKRKRSDSGLMEVDMGPGLAKK